MKLLKYIIYKIFLPLTVSSLAMVIVSIIVINTNLQSWTTQIGNSLIDAEIQNIHNRMVALQKEFEYIFNQMSSDITMLADYMTYLLNNPPSNFYKSYGMITSLDPNFPPNRLSASGYYKYGGGTSPYFNVSSLIDDPFRTLYKSSKNYELLLLAFTDGFFRRYPFSKADNYVNFTAYCEKYKKVMVGYRPECRAFYAAAEKDKSRLVFADPHSQTNGASVISASKALFYNGSFVGVISANVLLKPIDEIMIDKVMINGYTFMVNSNNDLISYPNLDRSSIKKLKDYEGINVTYSNGTMTYLKNGEEWYLLYESIPGTDYIACIAVPWADMRKAKIDLERISENIIRIVIAVTVVILVLLLVISIIVNKRISIKMVKPLHELIVFLDKLSKQNFRQILKEPDAKTPKEIIYMYSNFKDLFEAIKFGNSAYQNRNWQVAMNNYAKTEELMIRCKNSRGLGIVYSNKANAMRLMNLKHEEVVHAYEIAIEAAEKLLETGKGEYDERTLKIDLGDRLMNYGVYFMEIGDYDNSKKYLDQALNIHKSVDNCYGLAKTSGNMSQLYIQMNDLEEAEKILINLLEYAKISTQDEEHTQRLMQYAYMYLGLLYLAKSKTYEAMTYFSKSLSSASVWDKQAAMICVNHLIEYHQKNDNTAAIKLLEEAFPIASKSKHVSFVLDISGSMSNIINQCRKSIIEIVKRLNPNDSVSLYTFNNDVMPVFFHFNVAEKFPEICRLVETKTRKVEGQTAFYDAFYQMMTRTKKKNEWVIALTDGDDNRSKVDHNTIIREYPKFLCNIIIITVGELKTYEQINSICVTAKNNGKVGAILQTSETLNDIADTFSKAGEMILRGDVVQQEF